MIPTINDIIDGLINGTVTKADATKWLQAHLEMAAERYQEQEEDHYHI